MSRAALRLVTLGLVGVMLLGCASRPSPPPKPATSAKAQSKKGAAPSKSSKATPAPKYKRAPNSTSRSRPAAQAPAAVAKANRNFLRPASGPVIASFDGRGNKGMDFAGAQGDPVFAARDGRVVYSDGLRGYGQLLLIEHDETFLTAYAHNSLLLVKKGQSVKKGQVIAHMGSTQTDRVKLHFELRRNGHAVDPAQYLEARR